MYHVKILAPEKNDLKRIYCIRNLKYKLRLVIIDTCFFTILENTRKAQMERIDIYDFSNGEYNCPKVIENSMHLGVEFFPEIAAYISIIGGSCEQEYRKVYELCYDNNKLVEWPPSFIMKLWHEISVYLPVIDGCVELAFDDVTLEDYFPPIQGLAEAVLIASKLSRRDIHFSLEAEETPFYICPKSPLSRKDLLSWKIWPEKIELPIANRKILAQVCTSINMDKINPDTYPALVADLTEGEHIMVAFAFGYKSLFQPEKQVTQAQTVIALAINELSDIEELACIEAVYVAEHVVTAHSTLVH
ncbi:hypothetical protein AgCh_009388 [Apium graveolens]